MRRVELPRRLRDDLAIQRFGLVQPAGLVQREKPNLYQKARIANRMKWALLEAKYPKPFVDQLAYALATVVAGANSQREV